jgi:hypothetical protein
VKVGTLNTRGVCTISLQAAVHPLTGPHTNKQTNHCCHDNYTEPSNFIVVALRIAVKNGSMFSTANKMQQCVSFALFSNRKIFRIAVNSNKYYFLP